LRLEWGEVIEVRREGGAIQHLEVILDSGLNGSAICYPRLTGPCSIKDRVLLNTTAVGLALGTGGKHFVVARAGDLAGVAYEDDSTGHIMKVRYTPIQHDVLSIEEQGSPHHDVMAIAEELFGLPVACCGLHSQVPLVAAAVKSSFPQARVAYVMTDQAALPIALSDIVRRSVDSGLIDSTITCGQAFGGDFEAVNLYSALLAAKHVAKADAAIVAIGPGVTGTATIFGHGGVAQGEAINAAAVLKGAPVAVLRMSFADPRERHRGVSHHTLAALSRIALAEAYVAVPRLSGDEAVLVERLLEQADVWRLHRRVRVERDGTPSLRGIEVLTMGRGPDDDLAFFLAAFAAGEVCARLALGQEC